MDKVDQNTIIIFMIVLSQFLFLATNAFDLKVYCHSKKQLPQVIGDYEADYSEVYSIDFHTTFNLIVYGGVLNEKPFIGMYQNEVNNYRTVFLRTLQTSTVNLNENKNINLKLVETVQVSQNIDKLRIASSIQAIDSQSLDSYYIISTYDQSLEQLNSIKI